MRRLVIGMEADCGESAALFVADEQATGRIFASLDYDADEKKFRQKINNKLRHLSRPQRAFARAVLNGVTWREMGGAETPSETLDTPPVLVTVIEGACDFPLRKRRGNPPQALRGVGL